MSPRLPELVVVAALSGVACVAKVASGGDAPLLAAPARTGEGPVLRVRVLGIEGEAIPRAMLRWQRAEDDCSWSGSCEVRDGVALLPLGEERIRSEACLFVSDAAEANGGPLPFANAAAGPLPWKAGEVEVRLESGLAPEAVVPEEVYDVTLRARAAKQVRPQSSV